jgi:hypothetical protein
MANHLRLANGQLFKDGVQRSCAWFLPGRKACILAPALKCMVFEKWSFNGVGGFNAHQAGNAVYMDGRVLWTWVALVKSCPLTGHERWQTLMLDSVQMLYLMKHFFFIFCLDKVVKTI